MDCQALCNCPLKDKMNSHHSHLQESILSHNIIDIHHHPGINNPVADGLSGMWWNQPCTLANGFSWSVLLDWEASKGIKNNILQVSNSPGAPAHQKLELHFQDVPFFPPSFDIY
jgi:hypothetical protein